MIDVSPKIKTMRTAVARAEIKLKPETILLIHQNKIPKGNPLEVAKVAAVQAAKNTSQIIPYCHPVPVDFVGVEFTVGDTSIQVNTQVKAMYRTGVEMEALSAASVAALTLYDMMKMLDETLEIIGIRLIEKKGGKSDFRESFASSLMAAVLVMSDSIAAGEKSDRSGQLIAERLKSEGLNVRDYQIIPDEPQQIRDQLIQYADKMKLDVVFTTGGTGLSPRDATPETMQGIIERKIPGVDEAMRNYGQERTPYAMLSRGHSGMRGNTMIINLPGSKGGVRDALDTLFPGILHAFKMIRGFGH